MEGLRNSKEELLERVHSHNQEMYARQRIDRKTIFDFLKKIPSGDYRYLSKEEELLESAIEVLKAIKRDEIQLC